jgi:hypothetical protein
MFLFQEFLTNRTASLPHIQTWLSTYKFRFKTARIVSRGSGVCPFLYTCFVHDEIVQLNSSKHVRAHDDDDDSDGARIHRGFDIAPVPLDFVGKDRRLVGLGSYIVNAVNAQADCNGNSSGFTHDLRLVGRLFSSYSQSTWPTLASLPRAFQQISIKTLGGQRGTMATVVARPISPSRLLIGVSGSRYDHLFFSAMALLMLGTVFVGFAHTYYLAGVFGAPLPSLIVHLHGAAFSCWILLLVTQTSLVAAGRVSIHRRLGIAGFILASL